jgi:hypothetical protein
MRLHRHASARSVQEFKLAISSLQYPVQRRAAQRRMCLSWLPHRELTTLEAAHEDAQRSGTDLALSIPKEI